MEKRLIENKIIKRVSLTLVWVIFGFSFLFLTKIYLADVFYRKSQQLIEKGSNKVVLESINKAISLNPYEPNYYRGRAKIYVVRFLSDANSPYSVKQEIITD